PSGNRRDIAGPRSQFGPGTFNSYRRESERSGPARINVSYGKLPCHSISRHSCGSLSQSLQPLLTGRWYALRRAQAIRAIERSHGSRVITMIHRQEKRSIFGFAVSRHIDLEGAQTIIAAIKDTPDDMPIDLVLHTPGGLVLAAMQIARAVEAH